MDFAAELSLFYESTDALRKAERANHDVGCRRYLCVCYNGGGIPPLRKKGGYAER
ncbi:hypothetical protein B0G71_3334 [Paraburkholderia sp. BL27I4N3]|nr:hypothetical protein B0G71_3334 [Paraburkholderia sp. BL27I4N3]